MSAQWQRLRRCALKRLLISSTVLYIGTIAPPIYGHIVPAEKFHPVAESYRRLNFLLNLNPVLWDKVFVETNTIAKELASFSPAAAQAYRTQTKAVQTAAPLEPAQRRQQARNLFEHSTRAVSQTLVFHLQTAERSLNRFSDASQHLRTARQLWASFAYEIEHTDHPAFLRLGRAWLALATALGNPGILQQGSTPADTKKFNQHATAIITYLETNFDKDFAAPTTGELRPLPRLSPTFNRAASLKMKLPPGHNINKQLPRPRQILNMAARGVDESETAMIALGDMVFDSSYIFGEPSRSLVINCNTCHNKGVTNPNFFIPGISSRPGNVDVSSSVLSPHANDGHFNPVDIPDLRGIRFTAPYGRNGRFTSLREFVRNGIRHEFNGPEPDPLILDAMIAYMNEFDFLPNPYLNPDGTLNDKVSKAAKRGERLFHKRFKKMAGRSCASCHIPSDHFLDRKRHNIGTVQGSSPYSRDGALDTPTLLSAKFTAPYFHDGSQPTLRAVVEWFDQNYRLGLSKKQLADLTAYLETVGDGVDAYEDSPFVVEAEMEEFSFFLSTYEFLKQRQKPDIMNITFQTIAVEIRAHKWGLQDLRYLPVMEQLAQLMDEAYAANKQGKPALVDAKVAAYRKLYRENVDNLK